MYLCPSAPWVRFNYRPWRSIPRDFFLADHTLPTRPEPVWQKMAQSPLNLYTLKRRAEVQPWTENSLKKS